MRACRLRKLIEILEVREVPATPAAAPSLGPPPAPSANVVWVSNVTQLQNEVANLQSNETIVIQPGTYQLTAPLYVGLAGQVTNATIRGATDNYADVVIKGAGMDVNTVKFGFSIYNAQDLTIANLSIGEVWFHAVDMQGGAGADRIDLYHCRIYDSGEQLIKSNPGDPGVGVDDVTVDYCLLEYTNGPSTVDHGPGVGYTNAISAIGATGWQVRNNLVRNLHTPDSAQYLWNPGFLFWQNSANTTVEGNTFIDCDRAIAFGLFDNTGFDHQGGIIRNNFVYQRPGLFSANRRAGSDAQICVNDSPNTKVYHNTVMTNNNSIFSIEVRWGNSGVAFDNNLADAPFSARNGGVYSGSGNYLSATSAMFVDPANANFHVVSTSATLANVIDRGVALAGATADFDLSARPNGTANDVGADEFGPAARVQSVGVNGGAAQRSRVVTLTVAFDQLVTFTGPPQNAFELKRQSDNKSVTLAATVDQPSSGTVVTLTFVGGAIDNPGGFVAPFSLDNGRYTLTINAAQVLNGGGASLDGDGNGIAGGNFQLIGNTSTAPRLFRLFGDGDGNGRVDASDFAYFRSAYGTGTSFFDRENDGDTDASDFSSFRGQFGASL